MEIIWHVGRNRNLMSDYFSEITTANERFSSATGSQRQLKLTHEITHSTKILGTCLCLT